MEKILALYDQDQSYAVRFSRYVQNRKQFPFALYTFTDLNDLRQFADRREIEILLASGAEGSDLSLIRAHDVVHLAEGDAPDAQNGGKYISKYQSGDMILRELMGFYGNSGHSIPAQNGYEADAVMIFSPNGRCGKSQLALSLAKALSDAKRTLYITFEEVSWLTELTGSVHKQTLTEALYYFKEDALDALKLKALVYADGALDYIAPVRNPSDLSALTPDEFGRFLHLLQRLGGYDIIVIDTDCAAGRFSEIFRRCRRILIPAPRDQAGTCKLEKFRDFIEKNGDGSIKNRIRVIELPHSDPDLSRHGMQRLAAGERAQLAHAVIRNHVFDES